MNGLIKKGQKREKPVNKKKEKKKKWGGWVISSGYPYPTSCNEKKHHRWTDLHLSSFQIPHVARFALYRFSPLATKSVLVGTVGIEWNSPGTNNPVMKGGNYKYNLNSMKEINCIVVSNMKNEILAYWWGNLLNPLLSITPSTRNSFPWAWGWNHGNFRGLGIWDSLPLFYMASPVWLTIQ